MCVSHRCTASVNSTSALLGWGRFGELLCGPRGLIRATEKWPKQLPGNKEKEGSVDVVSKLWLMLLQWEVCLCAVLAFVTTFREGESQVFFFWHIPPIHPWGIGGNRGEPVFGDLLWGSPVLIGLTSLSHPLGLPDWASHNPNWTPR